MKNETQFFVKSLTGKLYTIKVDSNQSIESFTASIKQSIFEQDGTPIKSQRLFGASKELPNDTTTVQDLLREEQLNLVLRLPAIGEEKTN